MIGDAASYATLSTPYGVCGLANGTIFITDLDTYLVRSVVGGIISAVAGISGFESCTDGAELQDFRHPACVVLITTVIF